MNGEKLVSIALTTYNGEKYLREQLDSIYNQTYKNIEVVACDDGSKDKTVEILDEYKQKYGLKYFINKKNLGFTKNFEKVLGLCSGDFIAISDQDDIWLPEKIELLMDNIKDKTLIHSDSSYIDENGTVFRKSVKETGNLKKYALNSNKYALWVSFILGHSCLFRRELLEKGLPIPESEPYDIWLPVVASRLSGIEYIHKPLVMFRQHKNNSSKVKKKLLYNIYLKFGKVFYRPLRAFKRFCQLKLRGL